MKRNDIIQAIYRLITRKSAVLDTDPMLSLVEDTLSELNDKNLEDFFFWFGKEGDYFNKEGFSSVPLLVSAVRKYQNEMLNDIWGMNNIDKKSYELTQKLCSVATQLHRSYYISEIEEKAKAFERKLENFINKETQKPAFNDEEQKIIRSIGFFSIISLYINSGSHAVKESVENEYKSLLTREMIGDRNKRVRLRHHKAKQIASFGSETLPAQLPESGKNEKPISKKVISLMDGIVTPI